MSRRVLFIVVAVALAIVGCGPASSESPTATQGAVTDEEGPYRLTFVVANTTPAANEPIEGQAQLELRLGQRAQLSGAGGGPFAFEFAEITGARKVIPVWDAACAGHEVRAGAPLASRIVKSGGWSDEEPDADFYRAFFQGPEVRLPPGVWDITALATFSEGAGCGGRSVALRATVRVEVAG